MAAVEIPVEDQASRDFVRRGGWYTFAFILGLTLFAFVDRQILSLVAAPMSAELKLSDSQLGAVMGLATVIFTALCVYPIAWAADRFDRRLVLGLCIAIWSLGTAACGLARNYPELLVAAIAVAAGETALGPIGMSVIPDLFFGRKRVLANALYYIFTFLGVSVGFALGGAALTLLGNIHPLLALQVRAFSAWRLSFFIVALPAPLFLLLTVFAILNRPVITAPRTKSAARLWPYVKQHARAFALINAALAFYMLAFGCFLTWLPTANSRLFATSGADNGLGLALATGLGMIAGVTIGTLAMRHLLPRRGAAGATTIAWVLESASTPILLLFPFIAAAWQGFALLGAMMIAGTAIGSLVPNILQGMAPGFLRARVIALYTLGASLIGGSAPTIVGIVSNLLGHQPRQLLFAMCIVAVPCWILSVVLFGLSETPLARLMAAAETMDDQATA